MVGQRFFCGSPSSDRPRMVWHYAVAADARLRLAAAINRFFLFNIK